MASTAIAVSPGLFINASPAVLWSTATSATAGPGGAYTVTLDSRGILVSGSGGSVFHSRDRSNLSYAIFPQSSKSYMLILDVESDLVLPTRSVTLIDFTASPIIEKPIDTVSAPPSVSGPRLAYSQGNGGAFLLVLSNGTRTSAAIYRSDTGAILCSGPGSWVPSGETQAEATATKFIIHYSTGGTSHTAECLIPT